MPTHEHMPWQQLLELALATFKISTENFWAMTPTEFSALIKAYRKMGWLVESELPANQTELLELMQCFPD